MDFIEELAEGSGEEVETTEVEELSEEPVEEAEETTEDESEEEAPVEEPATEEPKPAPKPDEPFEAVPSYEQTFEHFKNQALVQALKHNGIAVSDSGEDLDVVITRWGAENPAGLLKIDQWASKKAYDAAQDYYKTTVAPAEHRNMVRRVSRFVNTFKEDFEDVEQFLPEMNKLAPQFFKRYPHLQSEPEQALPLLYAKAKANAAGKSTAPKKPVGLERGGARQTKAPGAKPKVKTSPFAMKNADPLAGIFGG